MLRRILRLPKSSKLEFGLIFLILLFTFCVKPFQITKVFHLGKFSFMDLPLINGSLIYIIISLSALYYFRKVKYGLTEVVWLLILSFSMLSIVWSVNPALNMASNAILTTAFLTYVIFKGFLERTNGHLSHEYISLLVSLFSFIFCLSYLYFNRDKIFMILDGQAGLEIMQDAPSFVGGKNHTSMFLFFCFPFILFSFYSQRLRNFSIVMLLIVLSTLVITESRNAILSLVISVGAIFVLYKVPKLSKLIPGVLIVGAIAFLILVFNVDNAVGLRNLDYRFKIWGLSMELFQENSSMLGIGSGQWNILKDNITFLGGNYNYVHAHSDFMTYFTELGPIGLLLFVGFVSFLSKKALDNHSNIRGVGQGWVDKVIMGFFLGSIVLFSFDELKMKLNHFQLLAILWAYIVYRNESRIGFNFKHVPQIVFKGLTAIIAIGLFIYGFLLVEQSVVLSNYNKVYQDDKSQALEYLNQFKPSVVNKCGINTFWTERSRIKLELGDREGVLADLNTSLKYYPHDIQTHKELVLWYLAQKDYEMVFYHLKQLRKFFDENKFLFQYIEQLESAGFDSERLEELKKPLDIIYN